MSSRRTSIYLPDELYKILNDISKESKIGLSVNQIILNCIISGLKNKYNIDY